MPSPEKQSVPVTSITPIPTVAEIDRIAALPQAIVRNLQITQCYAELSAAFAARTGPGANWCTFATWASKQAGQTIRKEDMRRTLLSLLGKEPVVQQALTVVATLAKELGARPSLDQIRKSALFSLVASSVDKASDAIGRGNKKVFEEIAREFARFAVTCFNDTTYADGHIADFSRKLQPGDPPNGQEYLRRAFGRYYRALFEEDKQKRAELHFLANIEIGFHEQTRLQPEIAESLNAASVNPQEVKKRLFAFLFPDQTIWQQMQWFFQRLFGKTSLFDKAVETLVQRARHHVRRILTTHLLTLTFPPDTSLRLGQDLGLPYPVLLKELANADLLALLKQIDPTPNSLAQSGAADWADLAERLHYIADLFRCYHETKDLFAPPFTAEQVAALKAGLLPAGKL